MSTATDFLKKVRPKGPWLLVACDPHNKKNMPIGLTFTADQVDKMDAWIEKMNANLNIYFSVNPTISAINKKAKRTDIAAVEYLHVDVDPRAGENLQEEQERILQSFRDFKPRPSCVVFSGGGYQGFWKLKEPIPINGEEAKFEDAKRYNMQLEILLGGDNCHNVDRIMRVPGTWNIPDEKKKAKGRTKVLAELLYFDSDVEYAITQFTAAQTIQNRSSASREFLGGSVSIPEISGNVARLDSVDDLPETVKPIIKLIIVQGHDPDEPNRFESRSHALFYVCCELVRAKVEPEVIFSVITDPDFKISESVVELGSRAEAYALKQIKSATEQAEAPELRELNERHAVISSMGGKCRVVSREWDHAFDRTKIVRQGFEDFRNRYMNRKIKIGQNKGVDQFMPLGKWWLENEKREQYDSMVFVPGKETPGAFNLWQGFNCEQVPGDCSLYLNHLKNNICSGHEGYYKYFLTWLAVTVQKPDISPQVAVVLRGEPGTGKGVVAKHFGYIFGQHYLQITNTKHLVGSFNSHLRDCVFLFADEAFYAGDKKNESILKGLITEPQIMVEPKGVDAELSRNFLHVLMASNSEWCVPVEMGDRRFFILDVSSAHKEDKLYFEAIQKQMENGGYEALLHFLMTYDISGYDYSATPKTEALREQKALNLSPEEAWWYDKLQEGRLLVRNEKWETTVPKDELFMDYCDFVRRPGSNLFQSRCTTTRMTQFLTHFCPLGYPIQRTVSMAPDPNSPVLGLRYNSKPRCYSFPRLEECRDAWDKLMGCKTPWQDVCTVLDGSPF